MELRANFVGSMEFKSRLQRFLYQRTWAASSFETREGSPLFTFRSNVCYNGFEDSSVPLPEFAIHLRNGDVVQVAQMLDDNWWIGRIVGQGPQCRYIPRQRHRHSTLTFCCCTYYLFLRFTFKFSQLATSGGASGEDQDMSLAVIFNRTDDATYNDYFLFAKNIKEMDDCYTIVPNIRPLVFFGPCRADLSLAELMQRSLIVYLLKSFPNNLSYMHCHLRTSTYSSAMIHTHTPSDVSDPLIHDWDSFQPEDVKRIYRLAQEGKMAIIQTNARRPEDVRRSSIMPLIAFIRIPDPGTVIPRILQAHPDINQQENDQVSTAETLNTLENKTWDLIIKHCRFDVSCYEVAAYVDAYFGESTLDLIADPRLLQLP
eukprot:gene1370-4546_t